MSGIFKNKIWNYVLIFFGTFFMAISLNVFFEPNNIVTGGATGIAVIIKYLTEGFFDGGVSLGVSNFIINLPLFLIAIKVFGFNFIFKTLVATVLLSFNLEITSWIPAFYGDYFIISVIGGVLMGFSLALIFIANATTGGSDMAASLIHNKIKCFTIANIMFFIDTVIIAFGYFIFGFLNTMYAVISVFITSKVIDAILEGINFSKATFIISDKKEQIYEMISSELKRGVTLINAQGMFSKENKDILLCVVSNREIFRLKEIVKSIDKDAFVIVADVREVLGEGF